MTTLDLSQVITVDQIAVSIADSFQKWQSLRSKKVSDWEEIRKYVYATDTTQTTNSKLPWKNKTTIPKLTQIADNLYANYIRALFPKTRWLTWEGSTETDEIKRSAIESYMSYAVDHGDFQKTVGLLVEDFIHYGNAIATVDWFDGTVELPNKIQAGYVGPVVKRVSPLDIVFDPTATDFTRTPKIIRTQMSMGELKDYLTRSTGDKQDFEAIWTHIRDNRGRMVAFTGDISSKDTFLNMDGFSNFRDYMSSDTVEVLTFYGDLYVSEIDEFYKNHIITVVDRTVLISNKPNPSFFGEPPIYHVGWRPRQDNLWAMGPLDNLVGMQYRIDHLENLKADVFDLIAFPPLMIRGLVEDFKWAPMERIIVGDDGDVKALSPETQALNANLDISILQQTMEEMAGAPKEAMGFRSPGEKTMYEVQRLENAASRIFQTRIIQFEQLLLEPVLSAMLELARRNLNTQTIRVWDDDLQVATFLELTAMDITGNGRIRPMAARHFAEQAELVQNLTNFFASAIGQDPLVRTHFSTIKTARMMEDVLGIDKYQLVQPYVRVAEEADAQRLMNTSQEQVLNESQTPGGIQPGDVNVPTQ